EEALLALARAGRALLIAEHHYAAGAVQQLANPVRREPSALTVVRRHEAHDLLRLQVRVDDRDGNAGAPSFLHRSHEGAVIERGQDDPVDSLREEALDDLNLLLPV